MDKIQDRRIDMRLLCAELVELIWLDPSGRERRRIGNLEDISQNGMCIQLETPIPIGTDIRMQYGSVQLTGIVRYTHCRDQAYFVGIELDEHSRWSARHFAPRHMLDPRKLVRRAILRQASSAACRLVN